MELVEGVATVDDVGAFVARLTGVADEHGVTVQAFDARYVVDRHHLERAVALADRAIGRGENLARERAVEILCYAAGRRQIDRALAMGVGEGEQRVVVIVDAGPDDVGDETDERAAAEGVADLLAPEPTLGAYDEALVREFYGVTDAELAATDATLAELVAERVALLDVEK